MSKHFAAVLAALALVFGAWGQVVRADESEQAEQQAAVHFEKGVELYNEGSLDAALVEFERAYELVPNYRLLYNLAQIQAERHQYIAAIELFQQYLAAGGDEIAPARREQAKADIAQLEERIAYLQVESDVEGADLYVDDVLAGTLPLARHVPVNPGVCDVRLEKAGYAPVTRRIKVASGEQQSIELSMTPLRVVGGTENGAGEAAANYRPAWVITASALALGGATLAFGLVASDANRALDTELDRLDNQSNIAAARTRLRTYSALTDGFAAASVVALGLAVYFWVAPPERDNLSDETGRNAQVDVDVAVSHQGLSVFGRF